jgi:hypothetical protein
VPSLPTTYACQPVPANLCLPAVCDAQKLCTCWTNKTATNPPSCYSPSIYTCPTGTKLVSGSEPACSLSPGGTVTPSPSPSPFPRPASPSPAPVPASPSPAPASPSPTPLPSPSPVPGTARAWLAPSSLAWLERPTGHCSENCGLSCCATTSHSQAQPCRLPTLGCNPCLQVAARCCLRTSSPPSTAASGCRRLATAATTTYQGACVMLGSCPEWVRCSALVDFNLLPHRDLRRPSSTP